MEWTSRKHETISKTGLMLHHTKLIILNMRCKFMAQPASDLTYNSGVDTAGSYMGDSPSSSCLSFGIPGKWQISE
jgi:hypothetical protein